MVFRVADRYPERSKTEVSIAVMWSRVKHALIHFTSPRTCLKLTFGPTSDSHSLATDIKLLFPAISCCKSARTTTLRTSYYGFVATKRRGSAVVRRRCGCKIRRCRSFGGQIIINLATPYNVGLCGIAPIIPVHEVLPFLDRSAGLAVVGHFRSRCMRFVGEVGGRSWLRRVSMLAYPHEEGSCKEAIRWRQESKGRV